MEMTSEEALNRGEQAQPVMRASDSMPFIRKNETSYVFAHRSGFVDKFAYVGSLDADILSAMTDQKR
jgi:hypothetical protein